MSLVDLVEDAIGDCMYTSTCRYAVRVDNLIDGELLSILYNLTYTSVVIGTAGVFPDAMDDIFREH